MCSQIDSAWYSDNTHHTKLQLTGDAKLYLERHLPHNMELLATDDEFTIVQFHYSNESEVLSIVKKWLPDIEIINNPKVSKKIDYTLHTYLNRNR